MDEPTDEELAGRYFDAEQAPGLLADGMPEDGIDHLRTTYVKYAVLAPKVVRGLRMYFHMFDEGAGRQWECVKQFIVVEGELHLEVIEMRALRKKGMRLFPSGQRDGFPAYMFYGTVQANSAGDALIVSNNMLAELLQQYGVRMIVVDTSAKLVQR